MPENPNPQGKGLVPVLQGLQRHWHDHHIRPKRIDQISLELFTSLFVLQSEIRFTPVPGRAYWLYHRNPHWKLSLVAPHEWGASLPGRFIGQCELRDDLTWSVELDGIVVEDAAFMAALERQREALEARLEQATTLEEAMPACLDELGYHGRVLAAVLGRSLRLSMQLSGIAELTYDEARGLLDFDKDEPN